jgi:hypothetical protein
MITTVARICRNTDKVNGIQPIQGNWVGDELAIAAKDFALPLRGCEGSLEGFCVTACGEKACPIRAYDEGGDSSL